MNWADIEAKEGNLSFGEMLEKEGWSNVTLVSEQVDSLIELIRGATNIRKDVKDQAYNVKLVLAVAENPWANMVQSVRVMEEEIKSLRNAKSTGR